MMALRRLAFFVLLSLGASSYFLLRCFDLPVYCMILPMPKIFSRSTPTRFHTWLSQFKTFSPPPDSFVRTAWQTVINGKMFIFSAFYDVRDEPYGSIRITAISDMYKGYTQPNLYCQLWYRNQSSDLNEALITVRTYVKVTDETHQKRYAFELLTCYLPDNRIPTAVSVSTGKCQPADNLLQVQVISSHPTYTFTVCTAPLTNNYSDVYQLVEFIESNHVFGADHFVLYDYEFSPLLYLYLKAYIEEGIVQLVDWPPLPCLPHQIHNYGQVVALTDCLYRHMFDSQHVAYIDLDEMIVPRNGHNWASLIGKANKQKSFFDYITSCLPFLSSLGHYGAFSFRNQFFLKTETNAVTQKMLMQLNISLGDVSLIKKYHVKSLSRFKVNPTFYPHGIRSKYIMNPLDIVLPGIHVVFKFYHAGTRTYQFEVDSAVLHHYRSKPISLASKPYTEMAAMAYLNLTLPKIVARHRSVEKDVEVI